MSFTFAKAYTTRRAATDGPPLRNYATAAPATQEMYVNNNMTGAIVTVANNGELKMHVAPIYKKVAGNLDRIIMNASNLDFAPVMTSIDMVSHFLTVSDDLPDFACKGTRLERNDLSDTGFTGVNQFLGALPRMIPLGYAKEWIEVNIDDQSVVD